MSKLNLACCLWAGLLAASAAIGGCDPQQLTPWAGTATRPAAPQAVPEPLELLLPRKIRIHPFTGTRVFSEAGGINGIDVRIEAVDAFGDPTKAFGQYRFELYTHKPNSPDSRGARIAVWTKDVRDVKPNRLHWNGITRTYQFKLGWTEPIPVGRKFVLTAAFQSRFTQRLFDQRVFVSGQ